MPNVVALSSLLRGTTRNPVKQEDRASRGVALGGIYGRAVVIGNLMHLLVGAFVLVTLASNDTVIPAFGA